MLTLTMLRSHWRDLLATLLALALGVAISVAASIVFAAAHPGVPDRYAGAAAIVRSPAAGVDAEEFPEHLPWTAAAGNALAGELGRQAGVAAAVPVRTFYAQLVVHGSPVGHPDPDDPEGRSWATASLAPYRLSAGHAPSGADEAVVSDAYGVRPGQEVDLLTAEGERRVEVAGTVDGPGIYLSDQEASRIAGGSTLIGIVADPAVDGAVLAGELTAVLPAGVTVLSGDGRAGAEPEGMARTRYLGAQLLSLVLVLTCFSAAFVVSQTFGLAAAHRRREVALLRALGATPGQLRGMLLREAGTIGVIGSVVGILLGMALAPLLGRALVATGLEPAGFAVRNSPLVLVALVLGPSLATAATWTSARRITRVPPLEAITAAAPGVLRIGRWRLVTGLLAAAGTVAAALAAATSPPAQISSWAAVATLLAVAALTVLGPVVLPPLVRLLTWPLARGHGAVGMLARGAMTTAVPRTVATMAPVLATVALATLVLGYVETGRSAYGGQGIAADATAVVGPDGTPGLTEDTVTRTRSLVGVGVEIDDTLAVQVFTGNGDRLTAVPAAGEHQVAAGTAVAARAVAARYGWQPGQDVPVVLPDGQRVDLRLAGIRADGPPLALPRPLVRNHDGTTLTGRLILTGPSVAQVAAVERPGVRALSASDYARVGDEDEYRLLRDFVLVALGLALGYTLLSIANTLQMSTAARIPDLHLLRLSGATPGQVRASLFTESLVTVGLGSLLGLVAGVAGLLGIRSGLARELGRQVDLALPWTWLATLVVLCAVLAGAAGTWPSRRRVGASPSPGTAGAATG